jgi:hypothetical protein
MARVVSRGEIWRYRFASPDKKRPVVVLSRQEVIGLLHTVMVAPVTSTIRGAPSEVLVGFREGLKHESAVNLDPPDPRLSSLRGSKSRSARSLLLLFFLSATLEGSTSAKHQRK